MQPKILDVFTVRSNPFRWQQPDLLYRKFVDHMLSSGVRLHVIECAYGDRPFVCAMPGVNHIGVRSVSRVWNKESCLNAGIRRTPDAERIAWIDADITFRSPTWVDDTLHALEIYSVVQPWTTALDLGPNDEITAVHNSFAKVLFDGGPVVPDGQKFWKGDGGPYTFPHPGFAWAITRDSYGKIGGLLDIAGMGSADHHMALAMVGGASLSMPAGTDPTYGRHVMRWQERALKYVNGNIGYVQGTIEHSFHGRKQNRDYLGRWNMFVRNSFNPDEDLVTNADGVYELAGNKPDLQRDFDRYLLSRAEDGNSL